MDRISALGFVLNAAGKRVFVNENLATGVNGTDVDQVWLTGIQEELAAVIEQGADLPLDVTNNAQLLAALRQMFLATASYTGPNNGVVRLPGGIIQQASAHSVPCGGGLVTTLVTLPVAFPTTTLDAVGCFDGSTPPAASGSISFQPYSNSQVSVTTNFQASGPLGIVIRTTGV